MRPSPPPQATALTIDAESDIVLSPLGPPPSSEGGRSATPEGPELAPSSPLGLSLKSSPPPPPPPAPDPDDSGDSRSNRLAPWSPPPTPLPLPPPPPW